MCTNSNMRKISVIIFALVSSLGLQAQQRPHYTQYILNNYVLNPALTGIENYTDVKLSHRLQWAGLDGAPVTSYVTIHGPLKKKDYRKTPTSFSMKGRTPAVKITGRIIRPPNHIMA
jgi:type IX secretion system PorP/SprF family membrane protein